MNRFKLILTALLATGTVCLSACTDESASTATPVEDTTPKDKPCDNPCTENERECRDNAVWACQKQEDAECPAWQKIETCGEGSICDVASHTCKADDVVVDPCANPCTENERECRDNAIWACQKEGAECPSWRHIAQCGEGTQCDIATHTCQSDCSVTCDPEAQMRCHGNALQTCVTDENGCGTWEVLEECEETCDSATLQCEQSCKSACTVGDKKCVDDGIATCEDADGNGCGVWGDAVACGDGKECKTDPVECIVACTSECKAGEEQVLATQYKVCSDSNGQGCMKWELQTKCKQGEYLDKDTKECKAVCGKNCEKFSIVFLPDTQEYMRSPSDGSGQGATFMEQLKWIEKNYKEWNIKAVMHLGDMTDTNDSTAWAMTDSAYKTYLDDNKLDLAYLPGTGNHDYLDCNDDHHAAVQNCVFSRGGTQFSTKGKFNNDRYKNKKWTYAKFGTFKYTGNAYLTMTVSGIKFLLMSLEFAPRKDTLCWAEEIIKQHPDHKVIVTTHSYLNNTADSVKRENDSRYTTGYAAGSANDSGLPATGASGFEIYKELAARHNNIILMAAGHIVSNTFRLNKGNAGNWFGEMLVDYQEENPTQKIAENNRCTHSHLNGGSGGGWMRILTFDPANYTIEAKTLSPMPDDYLYNNEQKFYCNPHPNYKNTSYPEDPNASPAQSLSADNVAKENIEKIDTTCLNLARIKNGDNNYRNMVPKDKDGIGDYFADPANTTCHTFTVDYDFVTPVDYKVTDGNVGFTHRTINSIADGNQETPSVAMSRTTRNFVAVWADEGYAKDGNSNKDKDGKGNHDIRARVLCETGCNKVDQFTVNDKRDGHQHHPDVAMNPNGDFVVVWSSSTDESVYMSKFNITGTELIKETKVNTSGKADRAAVAMADDGSYVVTWQDGDIYMRGFKANGEELFAQTKVSMVAMKPNGKRSLPDIGMDKDGNFVITWEDEHEGNDENNIRARGFSRNGSERIKEFVVNIELNGPQLDPSIGMSSNGEFTIAWEDDTDINGVYRIRMQRFDKDGVKRQNEDQFVSSSGQNATDPSICMDDNGKTAFSWAAKSFKESETATRTDITVRRTLDKTNTFSKEELANFIYSGIEDQPAIACSAQDRYVILWHDDLDGNNYYEIMGKGF